MFGGYEVSLDADDPRGLSVPEVTFDASKDFAISLTKNQRIDCEGTITSIMSVLGTAQTELEDTECKH